jgi:hypothetical protein
MTDRKSNMISHLNKKKKCSKSINSYNTYDEEQIKNLSLTREYKNKDNSFIDEVFTENNDENQSMEDENTDLCKVCKKNFSNKYNLRKHIKKCCNKFFINQTNITNSVININIINNNPIPFDQEWDLSKIDDNKKREIIVSNIMFTSLLENILKNEKNLNVILKKEEESGYIYKNENDKYISMKTEEILDKTMNKLHKHMKDTNEYFKNNYLSHNNVVETIDDIIDNKIKNYNENELMKSKVNPFISDIYDKNKEKAINIMKNMSPIGIELKDGF